MAANTEGPGLLADTGRPPIYCKDKRFITEINLQLCSKTFIAWFAGNKIILIAFSFTMTASENNFFLPNFFF